MYCVAAAAGTIQIYQSSGDPILIFDIAGTDKFTLGVDDSDGDIFKIHNAGSLADNSLLELDTSGNLRIDGTYDVYRSATKYTGRVLTEVGHAALTGGNYTITTTTGTVMTVSPTAPTGKIVVTAVAQIHNTAWTAGHNVSIYLFVGGTVRQTVVLRTNNAWQWETVTLAWAGDYTASDTIVMKADKSDSNNTEEVSQNYTHIAYACYS